MIAAMLVALATGALIPGTTLRLGAPLAELDAGRGFTAGAPASDSTVATRRGTVRFFGYPAAATLVFRDGHLAEAEFAADSLSPVARAYVADQLTRAGYRRRCSRWEPDAHVCDWSGRTEVHLEVTAAAVRARVRERPSPVPEPAPAAHRTGGPIELDTARAGVEDNLPLDGTRGILSAAVLPALPHEAHPTDSCDAVRPEAARRAGIFGRVTVRATVDTSGVVTDAVVERGPAELREAALECARRYRFQPQVLDGRPEPFATTITIRFTR